jgi:glycine dehydrogenase
MVHGIHTLPSNCSRTSGAGEISNYGYQMTGMEVQMLLYLTKEPLLLRRWLLLFDVLVIKENNVNKFFFVSEEILPQTLSVLQTRSTPLALV